MFSNWFKSRFGFLTVDLLLPQKIKIPKFGHRSEPGTLSLEKERLHIENSRGIFSLLLADIASTGCQTISTPDTNLIIAAMILFWLILLTGIVTSFHPLLLFGLTGSILLKLYIFWGRRKWDNIIIETKEGLILSYSVPCGEGISEVHKIEEERKKLQVNQRGF